MPKVEIATFGGKMGCRSKTSSPDRLGRETAEGCGGAGAQQLTTSLKLLLVTLGISTAVLAGFSFQNELEMPDIIMLRNSNKPAPLSGTYASADGTLYKVNTKGAAALSIVGPGGPDDLCLQFWRDEDVPADQIIERLDGQECSNHTFGDLDWRADYDYSKPNRFLLYPPDGKPFLIALKSSA